MSKTYTVEFLHQGRTYTVEVPEDQQLLRAAKAAGINLPNSCNAGVCTTCAAKVIEGEVEQSEGMLRFVVHCLSPIELEDRNRKRRYCLRSPVR